MKNLFILFIFLLTIGVQAQENSISDFEIEVVYDQEIITLECKDGCDWTELSFNTKTQGSMTFTDQGELQRNTIGARPDGAYIISVKQEGDRIKFESKKGTTWITVSGGSCTEKCKVIIDETGIEPKLNLIWKK